MKRIMIVDDEFLVRIGIRSMLPWEENGFQVIEEAVSGQDALAKIPACQPHIILTDLVMEPVDGLQLIARCRELYPDIQFIVLSNYNDFDKVKTAMKLGAKDFFFKLTANPNELLQLLTTLSREIDERRLSEREADKLISRNAGAIRKRLLRVMLEGAYADEAELLRELELIGVDCDLSKPYCLVKLRLSDVELVNADSQSDLLNASLESMVGQAFSEGNRMQTFRMDDSACLVVIQRPGEPAGKLARTLGEQFQKLDACTTQYMGMRVLGALSSMQPGLKGFPKAAAECDRLMKRCYLMRDNRLAVPDGARVSPAPFAWPSGWPVQDWQSHLSAFQFDAAAQYLDGLFASLYAMRDAREDSLQEGLLELYRALKADSQYKGLPAEDLTDARGATLYQAILKSDRLATVERSFREILNRYREECRKVDGRRLKREIAQAVAHVRKNLSGELSIATEAALAHMSECYFSRLFKSEMGVGFVDFVNGARIEKARELLVRTDLRIGEIAQAVGIDNPNYFSILFRKQTGMSPGEYRGRHVRG
jgi:two-component system response regulator YesN